MTVLYTACDVAAIMADLSQSPAPLRQVELANGIVLLGRDKKDGFKIERMLSANCNAYLLAEYQPGSSVRLD